MYDRVLVITINSYYSKVPSTGTAVLFSNVTVPRYNFSKVPSTGTAVLLRSTVPTSVNVSVSCQVWQVSPQQPNLELCPSLEYKNVVYSLLSIF